MNKRLKHNMLYSSKDIIKILGFKCWQDLSVNGRLIWFTDDTDGSKLYKLKI